MPYAKTYNYEYIVEEEQFDYLNDGQLEDDQNLFVESNDLLFNSQLKHTIAIVLLVTIGLVSLIYNFFCKFVHILN